jgi:predicted RNA binding protein YcfA (HicA-like mRNA interferase family)
MTHQLKPRVIQNGLTSKGFQVSTGDHRFLIFYHNGLKTSVRTMLSHSSRDIGDPLIHKMAKQVHLSKNEFLDLLNCPMSRDRYIARLHEAGITLE